MSSSLRPRGDTNAGLLVLLTVLILGGVYFVARPMFYPSPAPQDVNVQIDQPADIVVEDKTPDIIIEKKEPDIIINPPDIVIDTDKGGRND